MALLHPDECNRQLFPLLAGFFRCCRVLQQMNSVEETLLADATASDIASRQRLKELVQQLGDDHFANREAAERQLRTLGGWVSGPLRQLDFHQLDAEQQVRVQRILEVTALRLRLQRRTAEQIPLDRQIGPLSREVAVWLAGDPATWILLLERPEGAIRRTAAKQLACLLAEPIAIDPAADPETQASQRPQLWAKIERPKRAPKAKSKTETRIPLSFGP